MSDESDKMAAELAKVQQDLTAQRQRLDGMQAQIARFLRDREESLRGHKAKRAAAPKVDLKSAPVVRGTLSGSTVAGLMPVDPRNQAKN